MPRPVPLLVALMLASACPAAPPQSVPPTREVYPAGPPLRSTAPAAASRPAAVASPGVVPSAPAPAAPDAAGAAVAPATPVAVGGACRQADECASGVCEGIGCGADATGRCASDQRACVGAEQTFCSCDGGTFRAPADCPGRRAAHRGRCPFKPD